MNETLWYGNMSRRTASPTSPESLGRHGEDIAPHTEGGDNVTSACVREGVVGNGRRRGGTCVRPVVWSLQSGAGESHADATVRATGVFIVFGADRKFGFGNTSTGRSCNVCDDLPVLVFGLNEGDLGSHLLLFAMH